jgi:uncharacterized protein (DUF1697 family)
MAMADLRDLIEGLGYGNVRTLLNSGNAVFTASGASAGKVASRIEEALEAKLAVTARVTVLTAAELAGIVEENPLLQIAGDPSHLLVAVISDPADREKLATLMKQDWTPDVLALGRRVAYMWCSGGILESRLAKELGRLLAGGVTSRNWATILKLHDLLKEQK